mmetsp:Transcript_115805/g.338681  ORF Transcript_115805/g.338681 Transcript_115805/m.338681 type:complete len:208 (-) Transcript_115805:553-1176(-)
MVHRVQDGLRVLARHHEQLRTEGATHGVCPADHRVLLEARHGHGVSRHADGPSAEDGRDAHDLHRAGRHCGLHLVAERLHIDPQLRIAEAAGPRRVAPVVREPQCLNNALGEVQRHEPVRGLKVIQALPVQLHKGDLAGLPLLRAKAALGAVAKGQAEEGGNRTAVGESVENKIRLPVDALLRGGHASLLCEGWHHGEHGRDDEQRD